MIYNGVMKKPYNPTIKPKPAHYKVLDNLVENGGNKYKAIVDAGYSKETAKTPSKVVESKGFLRALDECGLTEQVLNTALSEDIKGKPKNRLGELTLAYKLRGLLSDRVEGNKTLVLNISGQSAQRFLKTDTNT